MRREIGEVLWAAAHKEVLLVDIGRHRDVKEAHHHFVVGLIAPLDRTIWIRVVSVIGGMSYQATACNVAPALIGLGSDNR